MSKITKTLTNVWTGEQREFPLSKRDRIREAASEMLAALKSVAARRAMPETVADAQKLYEIVAEAIAKAEGDQNES